MILRRGGGASFTLCLYIGAAPGGSPNPPDGGLFQGDWSLAAFFAWVLLLTGYFITAFAVMLGAPFWFDVLNKFMVIGRMVKPREKSQDEASEDRGGGGGGAGSAGGGTGRRRAAR